VPSALEGMVVGGVLIVAVVLDRARHRAPAGRPRRGWRLWRKWLIAGFVTVLLTAAAFSFRSMTANSESGQSLTVAFVPKALNSPFWAAMETAAEREAEAQGVNLVALAADRETDVERQFQIIENLIQQGVDAILLAPSGSKELVPAIRKANDAGIPVLLLDTRIDEAAAASVGARILTYIGSDNFEGGAVAGRYLTEILGGSGDVAIIEGISGHETADQRRLGFLSGIERFPGIRVVASQTANWERALAYNVAENLLQAHPEIDAIFAANDEMALGALEAADAAQRLATVAIIGFDAIPDALDNIRTGRLLGSVAQFPGEMGRLGVLHASRLLKDGAVPPAEILTKVELIDLEKLEAFEQTAAPADAAERP
jgi:ribose transport system substrate-binding protein